MKLLVKTSLYFLGFSIPVLLMSGFVCYYFITVEVKDSNNELLMNRKNVIAKYLSKNDTVALSLITRSGEAIITKTAKYNYADGAKTIFTDTLIVDLQENELAPNRMISSLVKVRDQNYEVKIWTSTIEFDELLEGIFYLIILILISLILISLLINFWISKTLWKPFYSALSTIKTFKSSQQQIVLFEKSSIDEFVDLSKSLEAMMEKMILDYNIQKKFTENASHEIQTPLAVIKSKIDLLIQSPNLKESELLLVISIDDACSKLARINKSLLLLTKIENRQFVDSEKISFEKTINNSLILFEEYIEANNLKIIKNYTDEFWVQMNPDLCLILVNNLLQNAIRYNIKDGSIKILMDKNRITIANTGNYETIAAELFERFHKNSTSEQSLGLGLSIVKEIAEVSNLSLRYSHISNMHQFTISINNDKEGV